MKKNEWNLALISSSMYVSFQIIANVLSTKIAVLPILRLAVDGGTVIYPLTFTLRDFVHKTWGKKNARQVVIIAAALNLVMVILFFLVGKMAPDSSWGNQTAYEKILMPVWRITLASILSQLVSELIDTEVFSFIYKKANWDVRAVLISNAVALVVDSLVFSFGAFFGVLPLKAVMQIVLSNILIKIAMTLVSAPVIRLIPRTVKFEEI